MGNTSRKTACKPMFLRRLGATSNCRNSLYEVVCSSIRLGGAMISLILPKLIRSCARDGILVLILGWPGGQAVYLLLTTEGKRPGSPETLPNSELKSGRLCRPTLKKI